MDLALMQSLLVALGLGLLVGLQREWATHAIAGIRTFPLITIFGLLCGLLGDRFGGWVIAAGLAALAAMLVIGNLAQFRGDHADAGVTTELAALVMFAVGALLWAGEVSAAVAIGGTVAVLLHWKRPLHQFAHRIDEADIQAIVRLAVVGLVILPALPDRTYGPYGVLNPFAIWLMVVLIVGISLGAYVVSRFTAGRDGALMVGVLGGLISSTATTFSSSRNASQHHGETRGAAIVILVASVVVFVRVLFEVLVVAPNLLHIMAPPLVAMMLVLSAFCAREVWRAPIEIATSTVRSSNSSLGAAVLFGGLYAAVLFVVAAVREHFGDIALYTAAALSGLTDMDAITLSSVQLVKSARIDADQGWRLVLVGALANMGFKAAIARILGGRRLAGMIAVPYAVTVLAGVGLLTLWP